jgi:hypothetical protein
MSERISDRLAAALPQPRSYAARINFEQGCFAVGGPKYRAAHVNHLGLSADEDGSIDFKSRLQSLGQLGVQPHVDGDHAIQDGRIDPRDLARQRRFLPGIDLDLLSGSGSLF